MINRIGSISQTSKKKSTVSSVSTEVLPTDSPEEKLIKMITERVAFGTEKGSIRNIGQTVAVLGTKEDGEEGMGVFAFLGSGSADEYREVMRKIGQNAKSMGIDVQAACLITESWMVMSETPNIGCMPDKHPERIDAVTLISEGADGERIVTWAHLNRNEDGVVQPLDFFVPRRGREIELDGLTHAFWEGYRGQARPVTRTSMN